MHHLRRRVDELIHRLHGEVEGHELDDRLQAGECRANTQAGKAVLGDRRIDDALLAELLQQSLRNLVGALIFGDFLAHHEDIPVAPHLLGHGVAQRFAHGHGDHLGAFRNVGIGGDFGCGAGFASLMDDLSSPSPSMTAIGVLTATSAVPSGMRILPSVPSSVASNSMVALSVSISAMMSPDLIASPSFLSHLARLPFSIVGDNAGMSTSVGMLFLPKPCVFD